MKKRSSLLHFADFGRTVRRVGWLFPVVLLFLAAALQIFAENTEEQGKIQHHSNSSVISTVPVSGVSSAGAPHTHAGDAPASPFAVLVPEAMHSPCLEETAETRSAPEAPNAEFRPAPEFAPAPPLSVRAAWGEHTQVQDPQVVPVGFQQSSDGSRVSFAGTETAPLLRYAMLKNGTVLYGSFRFADGQCEVTTTTGTRFFPQDQVEVIADSYRHLYEWQVADIRERSGKTLRADPMVFSA